MGVSDRVQNPGHFPSHPVCKEEGVPARPPPQLQTRLLNSSQDVHLKRTHLCQSSPSLMRASPSLRVLSPCNDRLFQCLRLPPGLILFPLYLCTSRVPSCKWAAFHPLGQSPALEVSYWLSALPTGVPFPHAVSQGQPWPCHSPVWNPWSFPIEPSPRQGRRMV